MNLKNLTIRILYFKTVVPDCGSRVGLRSVLLTHKKKALLTAFTFNCRFC